MPDPLQHPYSCYTIDGEPWAAVTGGTLLHASLLPHAVYEPPCSSTPVVPLDDQVPERIVQHHRAHPYAARVLRYVRAHAYADVEVYRDTDDAEVYLSPRWGRALAACDRLTRGPGDRPVLGWKYVAGDMVLRAVVAPSVLPVVHGWVRPDVESELAVLRKRATNTGRPSPRHRLRVAEQMEHPWQADLRGVRLAWMAFDKARCEWVEDRRAEVAWPFSAPVVGMGDLRALHGERV